MKTALQTRDILDRLEAQHPDADTELHYTTPFDFTLTFCEVMPLSDKEIKEAETDHVVRAPVRAKIVVPVQFVPNLIAAMQEHWRVFSESYSNVGWNKSAGPIH